MRLRVATACLFVIAALLAPALAQAATPGLVAAYAFDEGSGSIATDSSGNGHGGAIAGAARVGGRYGGALSFNGTDASVTLGSLGTFYQSAFTLEAWVQKGGTKNDVAVVGSFTGNGPMLWVDHLASRYHLTMGSSLAEYLDSERTPAVGQWQHVAATFDGATAHFYLDGVLVASRAPAGPIGSSDTWRIGAYGSVAAGFFDGLIDEVRIYDRALTAQQIQTDMATPVGVADASAPTTPANLRATASSQSTVSVAWDASSDDVGVAGYTLTLNGAFVATTAGTSFTFSGLTCGTSSQFGVRAFDGSGNVSASALLTTAPSCGNPAGLVAAYSFDEGTGTVLHDSSGNGHVGDITGAGWASGRTGGALAFDGVDDQVSLGSLGTFYNAAFTLEAWVRKTGTKSDVTALGSWTFNGGPMIWVDHLASRYRLTLGNSFSGYLDSGVSPTAGQWQHLAATYDGATARFYVDGALVASTAAGAVGTSDVWRIGAYGSPAGGFFDGLVDDVRVYDRALAAGEVASDMATAVPLVLPPTDTTPPSAPGTLAASVLPTRATLTWGAATDDVGVTRFNVHRSTQAGFTPSAANRIAQTPSASYVDSGLAAGTYHYRVTAEDGAGNVGPSSNEVAAQVPGPDTTPPTVALTAPAGGVVSGSVSVTANAADQWGIVGVQFKLDGANLGNEDTTAPYAAAWDSRSALNGSHTLTAVARDTAGNATTSAAVVVTAQNPGGATTGLRASYAFDESTGVGAADSSGAKQTGTLVSAARTAGRYGSAVSLDGTSSRVDLPALGTFYGSGLTLEAWVLKQGAKTDVAVVGSWTTAQGGGPMIWVDHANGRYRLTLGPTFANYLDSGRTPAIGQWQHVAATYDGNVARFYVDGVQTASRSYQGSVGSSSTWRVGAYGTTPGGFFDGAIDNVRIYDRPLSAAEIADNAASRIQLERVRPTVTTTTPGTGATNVGIASAVTASFSEPMRRESFTTATFTLRDSGNELVPATVAYDPVKDVATLTPQGAMKFNERYTARLDSPAITDLSDNALAAPYTWSFTTEASPPPVLVVGSTANPFGTYLGEILRSEGLAAFTTLDISFVTPALLARFNVVILGEMPLSATQVTTLQNWVSAGGNLVAMRPDKQLAGLLGLVDAGGTLANRYLKVDTSASSPGNGIVADTIQFHGTADRYTVSSARAIATLYSNATTATTSPAVSLRSVGSSGGEAAAFTYDLARSVVYTRQGNPAWAGQERDGVVSLRPNDMFYGAKAGDVQPDWIDTTKIAIPQADEQQRLLANLVTSMIRDKMPLPRFWYLPREDKAVVVLSGDDHSPISSAGYTVSNFEHFKAASPAGCVVSLWQCVRASSYVYPTSSLTPAQAQAYQAQGFEVALHPNFNYGCPAAPTAAELAGVLDAQLAEFRARYTGIAAPATSRTHCVEWPDWVSEAELEAARGIRLDANYYHYPGTWIGNAPGFMTGGGFPMRFARTDGSLVDAYQQHTFMHDEAGQAYPATIDALLDRATGAQGFYGAFGTNIHHDYGGPQPANEAIIASAQARGVSLISYKQLLDWVDGRNASTLRGLSWSGGTFTFTTTIAPGATGLSVMLPTAGPGGRTLAALTCAGSSPSYKQRMIKGLRYAVFAAVAGTCQATYS